VRGLRGSLGYVLWFVVVFAGGLHVMAKGREAGPKIQRRARMLSVLEKTVVAARKSSQSHGTDVAALQRALLAHGIRTKEIGRDPYPVLSIRVTPNHDGRLELRRDSRGRWFATASAGGNLELSALLPLQER